MERVSAQELEMVVGGQDMGTTTTTTTLAVNTTFNLALSPTNTNTGGAMTSNGGTGGSVLASAPGAVSQVNYFTFTPTWTI